MVKTFKPTKDNVMSVVGTANAAIDTARFAAAVAAANAYFVATNRPATILIDRNVHITGEHVFNSPTGLECTKGSWLVREDTTAKLTYSQTSQANAFSYNSAPFADILNTQIGDGVISVPGDFQLATGQWVLVYGFNQLTDVTPHSSGAKSFPMELVRINRRSSAGCYGQTQTNPGRCDYVFDDFLDEPYQTATIGGVTRAPRVALVNGMISGIRIRNFNYKMKDAAYSASTSRSVHDAALYFERCVDVELSNCTFGYPASGTTGFRYCANVRRHGCAFASLENFAYDASDNGVVYGLIDAVCTNVDIQHCSFGGYRHAYTTGGATASTIHGTSIDRLGATRTVLVHGNRFGNNGMLTGTTLSGVAIVNMHEEGRRITVTDNIFNIPGEQAVQNRGLVVRYRDAVIRNNTFNCGPGATPIAVYATRATISNNTFNGGLRCEVIPQPLLNPPNTAVDRIRFTNNTFRDFATPAIYISTGTGHEILGNTFDNCGYMAVTGYQRAAIQFAGLSTNGTAIVKDNVITKRNNLLSIHTGPLQSSQVVLDGNLCDGYGYLSMGLDRSLATTADFERKYLSRNNGGNPVIVVSQSAHGLAVPASLHRPINPLNAVINDTSGSQVVAGILGDVVDAGNYILHPPGSLVEVASSMLATGYQFPASGRDLYWDSSLGNYTPTKPQDSSADAQVVLRVHALIGTSAFVSVAYPASGASAPPPASFDYESIGLSVSDETSNLTTGTSKLSFRMPHGMLLLGVKASLVSASTGSTVIVDINKDGTSILGTKLSIDAGETTSTTAATAATLADTFLSDDALITIDIDQVGSTNPGKGLKVWLLGVRA